MWGACHTTLGGAHTHLAAMQLEIACGSRMVAGSAARIVLGTRGNLKFELMIKHLQGRFSQLNSFLGLSQLFSGC